MVLCCVFHDHSADSMIILELVSVLWPICHHQYVPLNAIQTQDALESFQPGTKCLLLFSPPRKFGGRWKITALFWQWFRHTFMSIEITRPRCVYTLDLFHWNHVVLVYVLFGSHRQWMWSRPFLSHMETLDLNDKHIILLHVYLYDLQRAHVQIYQVVKKSMHREHLQW